MLDGNSRRTMLKLMAASFGLAGLAACRRPVEHILPNSAGRGAENYFPGEPYHYTTVHVAWAGTRLGSAGRDPRRPSDQDRRQSGSSAQSGRGDCAGAGVGSGHVRSRPVRKGSAKAARNRPGQKFEAAVKSLSLGDGSGLRFLSEIVTSPTLESLRARGAEEVPQGQVGGVRSHLARQRTRRREHGLRPAALRPSAVRQGQGNPVAGLRFPGSGCPTPLATKLFSKRRRVESEEDLDKMNRLYAVESQFSLTGANADHRLRMKGRRRPAVRGRSGRGAGRDARLERGQQRWRDKRAKFLAAVVKDLKAAGAEALVVAGPRQPASVHALAQLINRNAGQRAASPTPSRSIDKSNSGVDALKTLTGEMTAGQVSTLVILGGNPAYTAPADLQFARGAVEGRQLDSPGRGRRRNRGRRDVAHARSALSSNPGAMQATVRRSWPRSSSP